MNYISLVGQLPQLAATPGFLSGFGPRGGKTAICNLVGGHGSLNMHSTCQFQGGARVSLGGQMLPPAPPPERNPAPPISILGEGMGREWGGRGEEGPSCLKTSMRLAGTMEETTATDNGIQLCVVVCSYICRVAKYLRSSICVVFFPNFFPE